MSGEQLQQLTAALKDRYRVIRELGRGGMPTVYVAGPEALASPRVLTLPSR